MQIIISPFSDKTLSVKTRNELILTKGKKIDINYHYYEDEGYEFTTDEVDKINLEQINNQLIQ